MAKPITAGAQMQCDKGAKPSKLKVTSQQHATINGKLQATDMELIAEENIPSFGMCKATWSRCIARATKWTDTTDFSSISGMKEITTKSTCMCSLGGKISFVEETTNSFIDNVDSQSEGKENVPLPILNKQIKIIEQTETAKNSLLDPLIIFGIILTILTALLFYLSIR